MIVPQRTKRTAKCSPGGGIAFQPPEKMLVILDLQNREQYSVVSNHPAEGTFMQRPAETKTGTIRESQTTNIPPRQVGLFLP